MSAAADVTVETWHPDLLAAASVEHDLETLSVLLHVIVYEGLGVTFVDPFTLYDARAFWRDDVLCAVASGQRRVLLARCRQKVVGTVQLDLAMPPNQKHRAEVRKLLVHPSQRRHGIGRTLMMTLESVARSDGRTLLTLDTWTGSMAATLYGSLGYETVGVIPGFARSSTTAELLPATIMYKHLA
jgi:GNAT superfamily N-acetyltransferase